MNYDKCNGDVWFRESDHVYGNFKQPEIKYTSVTTLIGKYEQPFDKEFVSRYKALEKLIPANEWKKDKGTFWKNHFIPKEYLEVKGLSEEEVNRVQQDILDEWAETNRISCERGTKIHAKIENSFYNKGNDINLQKFGIGGKFQCKKNYSELNLEYGVYPEYIIYYDNPKLDLHIAGQIDLLVKDGNDIILGDWKTNNKLDIKGFYNNFTKTTQKMKYPLTNIEDCNLWHYYLQLSTYAFMLQKINPDFNIKRLFIYHFDHNNNQTLYEVPYLKDDVKKMLIHFAKQQKIEKQKSKYARIEY